MAHVFQLTFLAQSEEKIEGEKILFIYMGQKNVIYWDTYRGHLAPATRTCIFFLRDSNRNIFD